MSNSVRQILDLFDALPDCDKRSAVAEILQRSIPTQSDLSSIELDSLANELFVGLDSEEAADARR